ncbi:endonuclease/exonuclease/phosphatase family protein [Phytoactinopolyspora halotolerans]|uniref:Endonuclease n=1 Tax=Phytoactinopolyspora halotolerans TaxID=1981512 RepID=A0A6L9SG92_9ACTN|nr:endonuclease/exonuclease/phosphatase family protein [Phytoactinopolyspora halotolerans]NEE04296.1 endonuclease [Phytoactinopolyspora halotolerans]
MSPFTFVAMTYNLWGGHRLAERTPALRSLFEVRSPDVVGVQELHPESRALIDAALPDHDRVHDDFPGWATQGNIWWRRGLFELDEYGADDVGIRSENARLFWARLRPIGRDGLPALVFSTAHLTWPGHPQERADDVNPRVKQARNVVAALDRIASDGPCVFGVDINDYARPVWAMREGGFRDSFAALGASSPVTHPVLPLIEPGDGWTAPPATQKAIDWLYHRGPIRARCSEVIDFFYEGRAPSDHKPVTAAYTLEVTAP